MYNNTTIILVFPMFTVVFSVTNKPILQAKAPVTFKISVWTDKIS